MTSSSGFYMIITTKRRSKIKSGRMYLYVRPDIY